METNPAVVFERLFGDGGTGAARLARMRRDRSILDARDRSIWPGCSGRVGPGDRQTMDEYLDAVRDVERRMQQTGTRGDASADGLDKPFGIPAALRGSREADVRPDVSWRSART